MKKIGFVSFGHWTPSPDSQARTASDALRQSIELAVAAEELGDPRGPRVSVSRSIFALLNDRDRAYFGRDGRDQDQIGCIDPTTRAILKHVAPALGWR
jgi:hypothetical protein